MKQDYTDNTTVKLMVFFIQNIKYAQGKNVQTLSIESD